MNAGEGANNASHKVSNVVNAIANKTSVVAQNVNQSAGPAINDAAITARSKEKLLADSITGTTINTTNGGVTLTSAVGSNEEKMKAEKYVIETEGVKSVKNQLVVKAT